MRTRAMRALIVFGVLLLGLAFLLPLLASAASPRAELALPPAPDPRWLALIRSASGRGVLTAQASAIQSINLQLTDGQVAGHTLLAAPVTISLTRGADVVVCVTVIPIPEDGEFFYLADLLSVSSKFPYATPTPVFFPTPTAGGCGYSLDKQFQPGDVVWVTQAGAAVTMTVPALTGLGDVDTNTVYGTAPAHALVTAYLFPFASPATWHASTASADGSGAYQVLWPPGVNLWTKDSGYVMVATDPSRRAYARFVVPFLRAWTQGGQIDGLAAPLSTVTLTVTDPSLVSPAVLIYKADKTGAFGPTVYQYQGWYPNRLPAGTLVTASAAGQSLAMTVLTLTAQVDSATGQLWGEAPPGQPVEVVQFDGPVPASYQSALWTQAPAGQMVVTASAEGLYSAGSGLRPPAYGAVSAYSPEGYQTYTCFAVPYLRVQVGAERPANLPLVSGQVNDVNATLTLTVQGPSGYLKDLARAQVFQNSSFSYPDAYGSYYRSDPAGLVLEAGDVVTLTTPRGLQAAFTLPPLTAQVNIVSGTVTGQAPPGAAVTVRPYNLAGPVKLGQSFTPQVVTATAEGAYVADFRSQGVFPPGFYGSAEITTPEGYTVFRQFTGLIDCAPHVTNVQIGTNNLWANLGNRKCPSAVVRLRNASGQVKAEHTLSYYQTLTALYSADGRPALILSGDVLEFEAGGPPIPPDPQPTMVVPPTPVFVAAAGQEVVTVTVPTLTVTLGQGSNVVYGQAQPGAALQVDTSKAGAILTATVSAEGVYSVSLPSGQVLAPGDQVSVLYTSPGLEAFFTRNVIPVFSTTLHEVRWSGLLPPLTPYTVSLSSPGAAALSSSGYADAYSSFSVGLAALEPGDALAVTTPGKVWQTTVPGLSAHWDQALGLVTGQAPPNAQLQLAVQAALPQVVNATATGEYSATFPSLASAVRINGTLRYLDPNNFWTTLYFSSEWWRVTLGSGCLNGGTDVVNVPITVTLLSGEGVALGQFTTRSNPSGSFSGCFASAIWSGDQVRLENGASLSTFVVPALTAENDFARQVLEGQAWPNTLLTVYLYPTGAAVVRQVETDAAGAYGMDTSDLKLAFGQTGYVEMTDADGNTVRQNFMATIRGHPVYLPFVGR